jgi:LruC domain-containing protein
MKYAMKAGLTALVGLMSLPGLARAQDADGDGAPNSADLFPCDPSLAGVSYYPGQSSSALMTFEDQWPARTDLDFNDVAVRVHYRLERVASGDVVRLIGIFDPVALGGVYDNGLALQLPTPSAGVTMRRRVAGGAWAPLTLEPDTNATAVLSPNLRELFDFAAGPLNVVAGQPRITGQRLEVEVSFAAPVALSLAAAPFDVFIFRAGDLSHQIHLPQYLGTQAMNAGLFGTAEDGSTATRRFVHRTGIPAALNLLTTTHYPQEEVAIERLFPNILGFASSGGATHADFYATQVVTAQGHDVAALAVPTLATPDTSCVPVFDTSAGLVEVLLRGDGADGSTTFTDETGRLTWSTVAGSGEAPRISTARAKAGGASMYFPGNGRGIKGNAGVLLGTGDFTMEFWAYKVAETGRPQNIISTNGWQVAANNPGYFTAGFRFSPYDWCAQTGQNCGAYGRMLQAGATHSVLNTWQHVAVTRQGNTFRLYVDGVRVAESVQTVAYNLNYGQSDLTVTIGHTWNGYLDELRITKGLARYTGASFVVETPVLAVPSALDLPDPSFAQVEALLHGNGPDQSTTFTDDKGLQTWAITAGTGEAPRVSTAAFRFGGSSIYFPGNGRGLISSSGVSLGTGDFTMEFWAYKLTETGRPQNIIANAGFQVAGNQPGYYSAGFRLSPFAWCAGTGQNCGAYGRMLQAGAAYSVLNAWQHVAFTRAGNTYRVYIDGVKAAESVQATTWNMDNGQADLRITLGAQWNGYLDDLRITKGVARYTGASFVPPTELPAQ